MAGEILAGLGLFRSILETTKALKEVVDPTARKGIVIELQEKILTAQEQQSALIKKVEELEKEIVALKTWEAEKDRYELNEIVPGRFVYSIKPAMQSGEPLHHLCTNCYNQAKKRILQSQFFAVGRARAYVCHECTSAVYYEGVWHSEHRDFHRR